MPEENTTNLNAFYNENNGIYLRRKDPEDDMSNHLYLGPFNLFPIHYCQMPRVHIINFIPVQIGSLFFKILKMAAKFGTCNLANI